MGTRYQEQTGCFAHVLWLVTLIAARLPVQISDFTHELFLLHHLVADAFLVLFI